VKRKSKTISDQTQFKGLPFLYSLRSLKDIENRIFVKTKEIQSFDYKIQTVNVDVTERNIARNVALEEKQTEEARYR
jgi:hypothetical protein